MLTVATAPRFTAIDQIPASILLPAPAAKFPAEYPDIFSIGRSIDNTVKPPYSMNANFSIGREFKGGWFAQGSYVGRYSRRSLVPRDAAMPTDLKDPKSGMTYFEAASILAATQVAYGRFNANPEDWTYALYQLDTSARTLSTIRSSPTCQFGVRLAAATTTPSK